MVRVISATCVVCRGIRISFAFYDYLYLDLGRKIKTSIRDTHNKNHLYECRTGAGFMRMKRLNSLESTHEQPGAFKAKMNTIVRTTMCQKIFCVKFIILAYTNG